MDALHAGADLHQPVGTAASDRGIKLGGVVLAMDENTASCMNFHRYIFSPSPPQSSAVHGDVCGICTIAKSGDGTRSAWVGLDCT